MPTFGDYETFGEPIAITEDRGHVSTVWRARKIGKQGDPNFAVKCYAPHQRKSSSGSADDALEKDPAQEFLAGIKQLQKAQNEGARSLVPVHDLGFADEGAWYVTDFYPRNTLKAWIARRGGVDSAALKQVVQSVVSGCLALKRSRGFAHGNLKAANVFLVGKPRPLRSTPLHLADAYPAAPLQLARLARDDRREVDELLHQVIEVHDLRALGEILLQLVEGRLVANAYDYNYPIASSPAWQNLGRDGERWRGLCNRLLDPQLTLEKVSLESLAKEFKAGAGAGKLLLVAGVVVGVALAGAGLYGIKQWNTESSETNFRSDLQAATNALAGRNYVEARAKVTSALTRKQGDKAATDFQKQIEDEIDKEFANTLNEAETKLRGKQFEDAQKLVVRLGELKPGDNRIAGLDAKIASERKATELAQSLEQKRTNLKKLLEDGLSSVTTKSLIQATNFLTQAVSLALELSDVEAGKKAQRGLDTAREGIAAQTEAQRMSNQVDDWLSSGEAAGLTNNWSGATNFFQQARDWAIKLEDKNRITRAHGGLTNAQFRLAKFVSEKEARDRITRLLAQAQSAESNSWNSASNSYAMVLSEAVNLNDKHLQDLAKAGIERSKKGIENQRRMEQLQGEVNELLASGEAAMKTNGWRAATNYFGDANRKAISLQSQDLITKSKNQLTKAREELTNWEKKQERRLFVEDQIRKGGEAGENNKWGAATNFYTIAKNEAKQLPDLALEKKADGGLQRAREEIRKETEQKQRQDRLRELIQMGDSAAGTNGWATATNYFDQALRLADKSEDSTLWKDADEKLRNSQGKLTEQIVQARQKKEQEQAYHSATNDFAQGNYLAALKSCEKYIAINPDFKTLAGRIQGETNLLNEAKRDPGTDDYSAFEKLKGSELTNKPPVRTLLEEVRIERAALAELQEMKTKTNWSGIISKMKLLPEKPRLRKTPFAELQTWATSESDKQERLRAALKAQLDNELECFKVWFQVGSGDKTAIVPRGVGFDGEGKQPRRLGDIGSSREFYTKRAEWLRRQYDPLPPDLKNTFDELIPKIGRWE